MSPEFGRIMGEMKNDSFLVFDTLDMIDELLLVLESDRGDSGGEISDSNILGETSFIISSIFSTVSA